MLRHHKFGNSNRLWRLVHIVPAVFVFPISLLIFDLDLSDFPLKQVPSKRVVVVTDLPKDEELANFAQPRRPPDEAIVPRSVHIQRIDQSPA